MKMLLVTVALAAAVASPALAQTAPWARTPYGYNPYGYSYIYPPDNHPHSSNPSYDVYDTRGRYVGSDPDPFIRDSLARGHGQS